MNAATAGLPTDSRYRGPRPRVSLLKAATASEMYFLISLTDLAAAALADLAAAAAAAVCNLPSHRMQPTDR